MAQSWVAISRENSGERFYPAHVVGNALRGKRLTYQEAAAQPLKFWNGKCVFLHLIWKGDCWNVWGKFYKNIGKRAKKLWFEFDADNHMNNFHSLDSFKFGLLFLYKGLSNTSPNFIWELPMEFNPFMGKVNRVPLRIYQRSREKPLVKKDIDILGFIDRGNKNIAPTFQLMENLNKRFNVQVVVIDGRVFKRYSGNIRVPLVRNTKFTGGAENKWHNLLSRSKVMVDLTTRFTTGRVVYEALFDNALCVCPTSYGTSRFLFPEFTVDPFMLDMKHIYNTCVTAVKSWSPATIKTYRKHAFNVAWVGKFVKDLRRASE